MAWNIIGSLNALWSILLESWNNKLLAGSTQDELTSLLYVL